MTTGALKSVWGGLFWLTAEEDTVSHGGKGCCQEKGAAGHIVSIVGKQIALNADTQFTFTFSLGLEPSPWNSAAHI